MFKIIALILFLLFIYIVLIKEKLVLRIAALSYFSLLSIVFMMGINNIASKYDLYEGPVLDGGFESLSNWVGMFSFLYIIPTFLIIAYILFKLSIKLFNKTWVRIVMFMVCVLVLMAISYVSFFIFTLIFYGFAP